MDVSVNPVLESVRPFFQGLPANSVQPPATSHPGAATPVQPAHAVPASSPSYWPQPQRAKSPAAKSPALASPHHHHAYNGTKVADPPYRHLPLPSINQIAPRTTQAQPAQFRAPDYPQTNHHSIYSPNSASSQSHRSISSSSSSYQTQMLASKYQSPNSPAVSSPSPHAYSYSPRTSLPMSSATTASSPVYPQTTSATSLYVSSSQHQRQQLHPTQNRPPSNQHPSHHAVSPVIQQPSQQAEVHGHLKMLQQHQSLSQQHSSAQQLSSSQHQGHQQLHPQLALSQNHQNQSQSHTPRSAVQQQHPQQPYPHQQSSGQQHQPQPHPQHSNTQQGVHQQSHQTLSSYPQQHKSSQQHGQSHSLLVQHQQQQSRHDQQSHRLQQQHQQSSNSQQQQHQLQSQQHHQLQQQAALYNQSVQHSVSRQSDAEKLVEMQQMLRIKQRQLAAVQAQQQAYYAAASSSSSTRPSSQTTVIEASSHQRTTTTQSLTGGLKRESPLDLSVKTVRQSADSTAKDDAEGMYLASLQSHEAFQHRSKSLIKTASPRNSAVLPPLQLPSTVVYPHFDNHSTNQTTAGSGAPKVDFLPNFNAHHSSSASGSASFQDPNKKQRKSSSQLPSSSHYLPHMSSLPHMGSFKKNSLPSAAYDDPNKQSQYYPATGPPVQRSSAPTNHTPLNVQANYTMAPNSQYHYDALKRGSSARYDFLERRNSSSSLQSTSSNESNYHLGKRQSSSDVRHTIPPKIPRVDTWRQTIDQQIEQRLNSYASSRAHQINGNPKESNASNDSVLQQQTFYSSASSNIQTSHSGATVAPSNSLMGRSSLFSSQRSSSSSKLNLSNQYYPQNQLQYPTHTVPSRSVQEPYNNLAQVKLTSPAGNGAADKRVLSILRKRLDTREASNQLLVQQQLLQQQSQVAAHNHDRSKMYSSLTSRSYSQPLVVPSPVISSQSKPPPQMPVGRHNLPSFNALSLDRNVSMQYPNQKLHLPKAMDSAAHEYSQNNFLPRAEPVHRPPFPARSEASGKPGAGENGGDFDGLAAFLAARIRTKAELKQVGPSVERTPTPASGSNSSAQSPRTTPGIFSPPPSAQMHYPAVPADFGKGTPTSESDRASSSGFSSSSPLKPSKDRYGINSPRRRLFCRPDDEPGGAGEGVMRAREAGLRSSSETSVFDFRDSDSEGETVSERQSLHEMRKDRDRRLQEKQQTTFVPSPDYTKDLLIGDIEPIDDSFWDGMCDQFVSQLEKGGNKVRKRGRRKKIIPMEPKPVQKIEYIEDEEKSEVLYSVIVPQLENIKVEIDLDGSTEKIDCKESKTFTESIKEEAKEIPDEESKIIPKENIKKEEESSDEDAPLALRKNVLNKIKETLLRPKVEKELMEDTRLSSISEKPDESLENIKEEIKDGPKQKPKKELSDSEIESSEDESIESVAKRLRMRKPKQGGSGTKRKTRSSEKENSTTPQKVGKRKKGVKKKSAYGDGSEFKPGWEAEVYKYKRSLRMPASLINIAGPQSWPRLSVSLPDLDPDSPMTLDSDISLQNKRFESDGESTPTKTKPTDSPKLKSAQKKTPEKLEEDSFINKLIQRYGGKGKKSLRKTQEKDSSKERKVPKIIPQTNELLLLPTPSLDSIVKSPAKKLDQIGSKQGRGKKSSKDGEKSVGCESLETVYLGYFRKKTVADFRDAFAKHNGGFATEHELPPIMLKSRTRTQTRILTQRATIREVFGEDRPASAPPAGCRNEENEESEKPSEDGKKSKKTRKNKVLLGKRNGNSGIIGGSRPGLRSAAFLRSNKAVLKSKQQLLHGGERSKRNKDLIKAFTTNKKYKKEPNSKCKETDSKCKESDSKCKESDSKCKEIDSKCKEMDSKCKESDSTCKESDSKCKETDSKCKETDSKCKESDSTCKESDSKCKETDSKCKETDSKWNETDSKCSDDVTKTVIKLEPLENVINPEEDLPVLSEKRFKVRRKLKSSGFDYIRKKKKQQQKKDIDTDSVKEKRKGPPSIKPILESEEDIQNEIKGWVINKGLGETVLHRAARLGYTDIAAYCLEKMEHNPSPRDNAGYTPLHEACSKGRLDIARLLLLYGADASDSAQGGIRPLHEAAESGCVELMRLLLSFGADPLLATYSGLTPLSLTFYHPEARTLLQNHLADVQGLPAPPWQIQLSDGTMSGCDILADPPSPDPIEPEVEIESAELSLPHLYQLLGEPLTDRWVLFQELGPVLRVKTREALIKQLGQASRHDFRDLKMTDFYDMAHCCSVLGQGDYILNPKAHKVTLVKYSERVRALLNSEKLSISAR